jgi:predicted nucleic acid-binding protein
VIVIDASAAIAGLVNDGPARRRIAAEQLHIPHLIDSEVAGGLRRLVIAGRMTEKQGWATLDTWRRLGATRYPVHGLLERIWGLHNNLTAYDAGYVALAEQLNCSVVTADARLAAAAGIRCPVTLVPR